MAKDLDAFVARSYVIARREIPRNAEFKIHASLTGTGYDQVKGEYFNINITTTIFSSNELNNLLNDFCGLRQECSRGHFPEKNVAG